jgi:hypothetical protein
MNNQTHREIETTTDFCIFCDRETEVAQWVPMRMNAPVFVCGHCSPKLFQSFGKLPGSVVYERQCECGKLCHKAPPAQVMEDSFCIQTMDGELTDGEAIREATK